jgi:hypothetical protein
MAWTTIPDTSLEPGKPIRSIDALALRDNPIAIAAGDVGAPRIAAAALQSGTPEALWVLGLTALSGAGGLGSYALLQSTNTTAVAPGGTKAGSNLAYSDANGIASGTPAGTWRCMGRDNSFTVGGYSATLWLRIA